MSSEAADGARRADQFAVTAAVLEATPDAVVVSNLGVASYVLAGVADRDRNVYLWGSMGVTTPVGLGLAMAVDDPVVVLDGDGSMAMSLGALATVATVDPSNLTVVVLDNDAYQTTGGQPTPTATTDFAGVARECGLHAASADTLAGFEAALADAVAHDGAALVDCAVEPVDPEARPPMDFPHIVHRVRTALAPDGA